MSIEQLEHSEQPTISVKEAATIMKVTPQFLRMSLSQNKFPFGVGVKMDQQNEYYINRKRFIQYLKGN